MYRSMGFALFCDPIDQHFIRFATSLTVSGLQPHRSPKYPKSSCWVSCHFLNHRNYDIGTTNRHITTAFQSRRVGCSHGHTPLPPIFSLLKYRAFNTNLLYFFYAYQSFCMSFKWCTLTGDVLLCSCIY
ncbi:DDB1- and CUL4-associated factor 5 [Frankliniella fusca]|uniref:DDB1- and CUL4-associated factor 5 n=1 Tax=Frankliniella fusca TaxID=407009 RepID=A0AAE1LUX2_9NEOP|nr:DDB1- and CUL4-associated factor 5 [Frankliniella fusca]